LNPAFLFSPPFLFFFFSFFLFLSFLPFPSRALSAGTNYRGEPERFQRASCLAALGDELRLLPRDGGIVCKIFFFFVSLRLLFVG
jgi:hypothetical protein